MDCRFCNIVRNKTGQYGFADNPFMENKSYFSIVSIGSFVPGWTLLVPVAHRYNLHKDYQSFEFYRYLAKHISYVEDKISCGDRMIAFEHGANRCDSETSCGTNHAHLHILPFGESLLTDIIEDKKWEKCAWKEVADIVKNDEYLLYCEEPKMGMNATVYVHMVVKPESQYFRKIIFKKTKMSGSYSYKEDSRLEDSFFTRELLKR